MTLGRLTLILAIAAALLGLAHVSLTPLIYPGWTTNGLWFVGTGLAILVAAAVNIVGRGMGGSLNASLITLVNLVMTGFFMAAWPVLPGPQVIVGGALFAGLAFCAAFTAQRRFLT